MILQWKKDGWYAVAMAQGTYSIVVVMPVSMVVRIEMATALSQQAAQLRSPASPASPHPQAERRGSGTDTVADAAGSTSTGAGGGGEESREVSGR